MTALALVLILDALAIVAAFTWPVADRIIFGRWEWKP